MASQWKNNTGVNAYLRYGDGTFWGWVKVRHRHGVTQNMIKNTTQYPKSREKRGTARVYETPAVHYNCVLGACTSDESVTVRAVNETSSNQGIITAYCLGLTICPQWVRDAAK